MLTVMTRNGFSCGNLSKAQSVVLLESLCRLGKRLTVTHNGGDQEKWGSHVKLQAWLSLMKVKLRVSASQLTPLILPPSCWRLACWAEN